MSDDLFIRLGKQKFPAVGRCIYCGFDTEPTLLSSEHIIPYSLGGNSELLAASCPACQEQTKKFEQRCAHAIFGVSRIHFGIQTRNPNKRPTHLPVTFVTPTGEEIRQVPVEDRPPILALGCYGMPGILIGLPHTAPPRFIETWLWVENSTAERAERMKKPGDLNWRINLTWFPNEFARLLAKIAHCLAVAQYGLGSFTPYLPKLILGQYEHWPYYVGTDPVRLPPEPLNENETEIEGHDIRMNIVEDPKSTHRMLICRVRLFPFQGPPTYVVVVGEPRDQMLSMFGV